MKHFTAESPSPFAYRSKAVVTGIRHSVADRAAPTLPADASSGFLHNVPNRLHRHPIAPCPNHFVDPAEPSSSINAGCGEPIVQFGSHPIGYWNRSNVTSFANQVNNGPMLFALLEMIQGQSHGLMPPKPTRQ